MKKADELNWLNFISLAKIYEDGKNPDTFTCLSIRYLSDVDHERYFRDLYNFSTNSGNQLELYREAELKTITATRIMLLLFCAEFLKSEQEDIYNAKQKPDEDHASD